MIYSLHQSVTTARASRQQADWGGPSEVVPRGAPEEIFHCRRTLSTRDTFRGAQLPRSVWAVAEGRRRRRRCGVRSTPQPAAEAPLRACCVRGKQPVTQRNSDRGDFTLYRAPICFGGF